MEEDTTSEISSKKSRKGFELSRGEAGNGRLGPAVQSKVHVLVVEADGLKSNDRNSLGVDPYCKLSLGKEKAKTKILERSYSPVWKESVSLVWTEGYNKLNIQVNDY